MGQLKVPKPKAIVMDLSGTAVKSAFIDRVLMPYIKNNAKTFIEEKWDNKDVKKDVEALRKEAAKDESGVKIAAAEAPLPEQQQSVVDYVTQCLDSKKESKALSRFRFHMWFDGYDKGTLTTPVYSDVGIQIKSWKEMDVKLYVLSNTWVEATKKFLSKTTQGDLNLMIDGHFDASDGSLSDKETYVKLVTKIGLTADQVLFLTKSAEEAKAAKEAGLPIVLVMTHRKNIEKLTEEEKALPRIRSFNELEFESTAQ